MDIKVLGVDPGKDVAINRLGRRIRISLHGPTVQGSPQQLDEDVVEEPTFPIHRDRYARLA